MRTVRSKRFRLLGLVIAAITVMGACGSSSHTTGAAPEKATPKSGGTLYEVLTNPPQPTLMPDVIAGNVGKIADAHFAIYDALVIPNQAKKLEYRLAKSIESKDFVTWTIHLREGVKFSDGTPFDAAAVKYNWDRTAAGTTVNATLAKTWKTTVIDPLTLQVVLPDANSQFPELLSFNPLIFIGSPTAMKAKGEAFGRQPVGAGAFVLEDWSDPNRQVLAANKNYFGGRPYLDKVQLDYVVDESQSYTTFQSGNKNSMLGTFYPRSAAKAVREGGDKQFIWNAVGGLVIMPNNTVPPFNDVRARKALAYAIDPKQISDRVFGGASTPADSLFDNSSTYHNPSLAQVKPDHDKAQKLFDELAAERGGPLTFTITAIEIWRLRAEQVQAQLAEFRNVKVNVQVIQNITEVTDPSKLNYQVCTLIINADTIPLLSLYLKTGGPNNRSGYSNPEVDAALKAALATDDPAKLKAQMDTVQKHLQEDVPFVFYERFSVYVLYNSENLRDVEFVSSGIPKLEKMWLSNPS